MKNLVLLMMLSAANIAFAQSPHDAQLYGMTQYGGVDHKGTIFHYTPSIHKINVDYEFKVKVKGEAPKSDIVAGNNGKYYGTTTAGGQNNAGLIFEWDSATNAYKETYHFTGKDGSDARGSMILFNGKLYGMTNKGGANDFGVIFEWDFTSNIYVKKWDMDSSNGKNPDGSMTLVGNTFWGMTNSGGTYNKGVIFEWNPGTNTYTKHYDFDSISGSNPVGKLTGFNGKLFAMTNKGGLNNKGVIFEWNPSTRVYTRKMDFTGANGAYPLGFMTLFTNNKFYGLTYDGGAYQTVNPWEHFGVLFEWDPATNVFVKKRDLGAPIFSFPSGHGPLGSLTLKGNIFWGITTQGGGSSTGAIFSWDPAGNVWNDQFLNHYVSPAYNFIKDENLFQAPGNNSYGTMLLSGDQLLGSSSSSGGNNLGCLFRYLPDSNQMSYSIHMGAADGAYPRGSLSRFGNKLFGLTNLGGYNHQGNIIEWDLNTHQFTERLQLDCYKTAIQPKGNLVYFKDRFYASAMYGKSYPGKVWTQWASKRTGCIFSWDPLTGDYRIELENQAVNAPFLLHDDKFYSTGGGSNFGSIIAYDPTSDTTRTLADFNFKNGSFQMYQDFVSANGLVFYKGKYYGMTPSVNGNFKGGIYEFDPVNNTITNKIVFADSTGIAPCGNLTLVDTIFYGLTSGGTTNYGSLFKWNPFTNILEKKSDLGYNNGFSILNPKGTLTYSGGKLYGLGYGYELHNSAANGVTFPGTVFEYDPASESITSTQTFSYTGGLDNSGVNPAFTTLLEVIPNREPVLKEAPIPQTVCNDRNNTVSFILTDADNDTMDFDISSSDTSIIGKQDIFITHVDSIYTIRYSGIKEKTGTLTISLIATDGYGGTLNFDFAVIVNDPPIVNISKTAQTLTAQQNGATYQWLDCDKKTHIPGATQQSFTPQVSGHYAVIVTGTCPDTSACMEVTTVGIDNHLTENFNIYPNPVDRIFHLDMKYPGTVSHIEIYNSLGSIILEREYTKTIDLGNTAPGVYWIKIYDNDALLTVQKIIKQ